MEKKAGPIRSLCVFGGTSNASHPVYRKATSNLGQELVRRQIALVHGGGDAGLTGVLASTVREGHGKVVGVLPESLVQQEVLGSVPKDTRIVSDMHERKAVMASESGAFMALPGGYGTIEQFMEAVTWLQLGYHSKPVGILNMNGFYDEFLKFLDTCEEQGFLRGSNRQMVHVHTDPEELLNLMEAFEPPVDLISSLAAENPSGR